MMHVYYDGEGETDSVVDLSHDACLYRWCSRYVMQRPFLKNVWLPTSTRLLEFNDSAYNPNTSCKLRV